jgi:hypothetical protein
MLQFCDDLCKHTDWEDVRMHACIFVSSSLLTDMLITCDAAEADVEVIQRQEVAPPAPPQPKRESQTRVLIVQPDDDLCCGLQLPVQQDGSSIGQALTDSQKAAKLVDAASVQADAYR